MKRVFNQLNELGYSINLIEINKTNGPLKGFTTKTKEGPNPVIYYDEYEQKLNNKEMTVNEIVYNLIMDIEAANMTHPPKINIDELLDFNKIKDNIFIKLVNTALNKNTFDKLVHSPLGDFSIIYYIEIPMDDENFGVTSITNDLLEKWNTSREQLHNIAIKNTTTKYPAQLFSLEEMFLQSKEDNKLNNKTHLPEGLYVLTNSIKHFGACTVCYPNILDTLDDLFNSNFYLIPSSIHEFIIMGRPDTIDGMNTIIKEANNSVVYDTEVLGEYVYKYNKETKSIERME